MPINTSDLYPTLAELLGANLPDQPLPLDGISLVPLLQGRSDQRNAPMFFAQAKACVTPETIAVREEAVILGDLKLYRSGPGSKVRLVSLAEPGEPNVTKAHPRVAKKLTTELDRWQESVAASLRGEDYAKR
jgi:hypothetical protein